MPSDAHGALLPGARVAGYTIRRVLGRGGFGIAYEGWNEDLHHRAAIKEYFPSEVADRTGTTVVPRTGSSEVIYARFLERFIAEARVVNGLDHQNIVKVRHLERSNGTAYVIMDFIDGHSLSAWLRESGGRIDEADVRALFAPLLSALEYVHARDLLHRDISPQNIMVDRGGKPVLIDFGAFKEGWVARPGISSVVVANPAFAPPEQSVQRQGARHGPPTDIYALAAVMYRVLAGEPPEASSGRSHAVAIGDADPLRPITEAAKIDCPLPALAAIDRALSLDPRQRPQTIAAFRQALGWADAAGPAVGEQRDGRGATDVDEAPPPRGAARRARQPRSDELAPDEKAWREAAGGDTAALLREFLRRFPNSRHAGRALVRLAELDEQSWSAAGSDGARLEAYVAAFPDGARVAEARARIARLRDGAATQLTKGKGGWLGILLGTALSIPLGLFLILVLVAWAEGAKWIEKPYPQSPYLAVLVMIPIAIAGGLAWASVRLGRLWETSHLRDFCVALLGGIAAQQVFWCLVAIAARLVDDAPSLIFVVSGAVALGAFVLVLRRAG